MQLRKIVQGLAERRGRKVEFTSVAEFVRHWLDRTGAGRSKATVARYRGPVEAFLTHLGERAVQPLGHVTPGDVDGFLALRRREGRSASTVASDRKCLSVPFALALRQGLILHNPVSAAEATPAEKESREPFTLAELTTLRKAAKGTEWGTLIMLGCQAGLRLGDAARLTWRSVDFSNAFLAPDLAGVSLNRENGLSNRFRRRMVKAGIESDSLGASGKAGRRFWKKTSHSTRHSYVLLMEAVGVAPNIRKKFAGHATDAAHARYSHTELSTLARAVTRLPPFLRVKIRPNKQRWAGRSIYMVLS